MLPLLPPVFEAHGAAFTLRAGKQPLFPRGMPNWATDDRFHRDAGVFVPLPAAEPEGNLPCVVETNRNLNHGSLRIRHLGGVKGARFRTNGCSVRGDRYSQRTSSIGQTYKTHLTNAQQ